MASWEMPAEPEGVSEVWVKANTSGIWTRYEKKPSDTYGERHWHTPDRPLLKWDELLCMGEVTDEDPDAPPMMFWSPGLRSLYVQELDGGYRLVWFGGETRRPGWTTKRLPYDARPMVTREWSAEAAE